jgi:5-methylcytosine-specific restriction endonuclease McrA
MDLRKIDDIVIEHNYYSDLLKDPRWKFKSKEIIRRDQEKCVICNSKENLQVHHRQYHYSVTLKKKKDPWDYNDVYLITLCQDCHIRGHQLYNIPFKRCI